MSEVKRYTPGCRCDPDDYALMREVGNEKNILGWKDDIDISKTEFVMASDYDTLRADLQRVTKDMKMWYANYKGVEAELNTVVYQLECVTAERDRLRCCQNCGDNDNCTLVPKDYKLCGSWTPALAAVKPETINSKEEKRINSQDQSLNII